MPTFETYKTRWEDFRIQCANLASARRWLRDGYANEDLEATDDELWGRVFVFEDRLADQSVGARANALMLESYRYASL